LDEFREPKLGPPIEWAGPLEPVPAESSTGGAAAAAVSAEASNNPPGLPLVSCDSQPERVVEEVMYSYSDLIDSLGRMTEGEFTERTEAIAAEQVEARRAEGKDGPVDSEDEERGFLRLVQSLMGRKKKPPQRRRSENWQEDETTALPWASLQAARIHELMCLLREDIRREGPRLLPQEPPLPPLRDWITAGSIGEQGLVFKHSLMTEGEAGGWVKKDHIEMWTFAGYRARDEIYAFIDTEECKGGTFLQDLPDVNHPRVFWPILLHPRSSSDSIAATRRRW